MAAVTEVADRVRPGAVYWLRRTGAIRMSTRKVNRTDRLELAERATLALALIGGVVWALANGVPGLY